MKARLYYGVCFGKGDSTPPIEWEIELTEEETEIYQKLISDGVLLDDAEQLKPALERAYKEIEQAEIKQLLEDEDEFTEECIENGESPFDSWDLSVHFDDPNDPFFV